MRSSGNTDDIVLRTVRKIMFIKGMLTEADLMIFNATSCYDLSQTSSGFEFSSTIVLVLYTN